jgi:DNA-binding SARP family transcriptional activator
VLAIKVLGPLTVSVDGRPVELTSPKLRTLVAALSMAAGTPVSVDRLGAALWIDGEPPDHLRRSVQTHLTRLRGKLGSEAIVTESTGYRLKVDPDQVDALRFGRLLDLAAVAPDPVSERVHLEDALALWRGDPFDGLSSKWQHRVRDALVERYLAAVERRVDIELVEGRHGQSIVQLRELTGAHPLRESLWVRLLRALAASGRQAEALASYESIRRRLADELGSDPGSDLQQVYAELLTAFQPDDKPARAAFRPDDQPGLSTVAVVPQQLPAGITGFTGRAVELKALQTLLDDRGQPTRAVVISAIAGMAGVGKTALAVHWAHQVAEFFPDGRLYVDLQGYAHAGSPMDPLQALAGLLRALGVAPGEIPTDVGHAAALYRSLTAGLRILVVLDNASSADQVRPLLPGSPTCMVLITSRDRLGGLVATHGVHRLALDVLTPDEALALLEQALGVDRVAAERAAARDLVRTCAFLPLALRIAAANLLGRPEQTIAGYLAELRADDRLGAMTVVGEPDIAVRLAFDTSYTRSAPAAQRLFRLVAGAPGVEVSVPAAAALAEIPPRAVARLLADLVNAHLVEPRGVGRFGLHDLLRRYGRERVDQEGGAVELAAALDRLFDHYLHGVDVAAGLSYPEMLRLPIPTSANRSVFSFDSDADAMAWLDTERANLVAAIRHGAEHGRFRPPAWLLTDALRGYFWMRRYSAEWLATAHAGLSAATAAGDSRAQAAVRLSFANAYHAMGRHPEAIENYTAAADLAGRAGWTEAQAASLTNLGGLYEQRGDLRLAADHQVRALVLHRQTGRLGGEAVNLLNRGVLLVSLGSLREAADDQLQALALYRQLGSRDGEAFVFVNLGEIHRLLGELDVARQHLTRASPIMRELGDRNGQASVMRELAMVHRDAGRNSEALQCAQAALALVNDTGDRFAEARVRNVLASVHLNGNRVNKAAEEFRQVFGLAREIGVLMEEAIARLGMAAVAQFAGRYADAADEARRVLDRIARIGLRVLEAQAHTTLAAALLSLGRRGEALDHARQALKSHRETGHRLGEARTLKLLGSAAQGDGDLDVAARCWQEARDLFTAIGSSESHEIRPLLDSLNLAAKRP